MPEERSTLRGLPAAPLAAGGFALIPTPRAESIRRFVVRGIGVSTSRKSQILLAVGGMAIVLLLAAVFTLGSLTLPFQPPDLDQAILYALSTFIVAALLVFASILTRSLVRLGAERVAHKPGSRFKTKMVLGAIGVSFLPVVFLFFVSYALLNRTLVLWFPRPLEIATQSSRELVDQMSRADAARMSAIAEEVAPAMAGNAAQQTIHAFDQTFERGADLAWELNPNGHPVAVAANPDFKFRPSPATSGTSFAPGPARSSPPNARRRRALGIRRKALPCGPCQDAQLATCWPDEMFPTTFRIA